MGRMSPSLPTRPRSERTRRRVILSAESLESRQLLSVAAMPPAIVPAVNVPAAIGPVVSSPTSGIGTAGPATGSSGLQIVLEINPIVVGQGAIQGFTETILVIEEPVSSGIATPTPSVPASTPSSSTPTGSAGSQTPAITPLTATILSNPGAASRGAIGAVIASQPLVNNFGPSTIPVTTQAILNTATLEEQPLQPPVLGQGFESGQTQGIEPRIPSFQAPTAPVPLEPNLPATDYLEPIQPANEAPPAPQPAQPAEPPAPAAPVAEPEPLSDLTDDPAAIADRNESPEFPALTLRTDARTEAETPSLSMAAMLGTAAIAGGGYHLVLGRSNRFNQRWLPRRGSSRMPRRNRPEDN